MHILLRIISSILEETKGSVQCCEEVVQKKEHQLKNDIGEPVEECEDTKLRDHAVPLQKGFSN